MKILFASNDEIALPTLSFLNPSAVLTTLSKESGRRKRINPIKEWAEKNNKKCFEIEHLLKNEREIIEKYDFDMLISFSFSLIFGPKFLSIFKCGCFNIHPSPLPLLRGPSPIQNAILEGWSETEVVLQKIALRMDEGDIILRERVDIDKRDDYITLSKRVSETSKCLIEKFVELGFPNDGDVQGRNATYTHMFTKDDGKATFDNGEMLERKIRAFCLFPKVFAYYGDKKVIFTKATFEQSDVKEQKGMVVLFAKNKGFKIACNDGYLYISRLCLENKTECDAISFYNGHRDFVGTYLT